MANKPTITDLITTDTKVSDVLNKLNEEIKKLKHIEETPWKTSGELAGFTTNLRNETLIPNILRMHSVVLVKTEAYEKSAGILIGDKPIAPFSTSTNSGNVTDTLDNWTEDCKLKIAIIEQKETLDTLNMFKKEMESFMSDTDKKEILFNKMQSFFSKK